MHGTPLNVGGRGLAVDSVAKHVKHARKNALADRRFQRPAGVRHRHAARQALRRRQRNGAHMLRIALRQHLDEDAAFVGLQQAVDGRQIRLEAHIDDAAAHRNDHAQIGNSGLHSGFSHLTPSNLQQGWVRCRVNLTR